MDNYNMNRIDFDKVYNKYNSNENAYTYVMTLINCRLQYESIMKYS